VKSYVIDEIEAVDLQRVHRFLIENAIASGVDTLFWVKLDSSLLTPLQQEHLSCQPHVFAVETGNRCLKAEFYLRTLRDMRCPCQDYCTPLQAHFVIAWMNEMLQQLSIRT